MSKDIRIKKGVNINLKGSAERVYASIPQAECFAIKPSDFKGLTPKLSIKAGDKVQAGSSLFFDKEPTCCTKSEWQNILFPACSACDARVCHTDYYSEQV